MGTYGRWRNPFNERRSERIFERAQTEHQAEAARAERRALEVARIQQVRPGIELHLRPSDWLDLVGHPIAVHVHMRVTSIHEPIMYRHDVGWIRIWGHRTICSPHSEHAPCVSVMARVGAILDAAQ